MRCPWRIKTVHVPQHTEQVYIKVWPYDKTEFEKCYEEECPYYKKNPEDGIAECRRSFAQ